MPFGFLRRRAPEAQPAPPTGPPPDTLRRDTQRGVAFTAITEEWRLHGWMQISGRLSDALNRREAIPIADVSWGAPEAGAQLEPAPGLRSVDPYDLILVTSGEDSLPPLSEAERAALKVHKVPYAVSLEAPPYLVVGTVYLHPGAEPDQLLDRSTEMFVPVIDAVARVGDLLVSDEDQGVILVNRSYLRGVEQADGRTGRAPERLTGTSPAGRD